MELVGVVDGMAGLVPQVAKDIGLAGAFDVADLFGMQLAQLALRQVEWNRDRYRAERNAPLRGKIVMRAHLQFEAFALALELLEDVFQIGPRDGQVEIANGGRSPTGFLKGRRECSHNFLAWRAW